MTVRARSRSIALAALGLALAAASPARAQSATAGGETPTRQPKLTKAPKLTRFVEARYPESEVASGKSASVVLAIAITEAGRVGEVVVVGSAGEAFDTAAVEAARQFEFDPAEIDGKPGPVKITYRYDFVLHVEPAGPVVNFEGTVRDRFTKKPLAGVRVVVEGAGEAVTDGDGHFELADVAEGPHQVSLSGAGLTTVSTEETIEKGKKLSAKYVVEPKEDSEEGADLEIVVVAPKIVKEVVSTEIQAEEGRRVPGTQGDTLKVVQNLPGVARAAFGSGQLVVWGAAPQDTRVYVDGVRIPLLYHGGGLRSTIHGDVVKSIELAPGGYGAEYGRGLGGLVTVQTRAPRADRVHGSAAVDVIDGAAMVEAPLGDSTRVFVTGRKSWLDRSLALVTSRDVGDFVPIPSYWDTQTKVVHDLGPNETIELFALASSDDLRRTVTNPDPAQTKSEQTLTAFGRVALTYRRQTDDGQSVFVTPSFGRDHTSSVARFGGAPTELQARSWVYGLRAGWRGRIAEAIVATAGIDVEATTSELSRRGSVTLPPREGDVAVFGQAPGDQVNFDAWSTTIASIAPYAQLDVAPFGDRLHVVPGLRVEPYVTSGSRVTPLVGDTPSIGFSREETAVEPRISVRYQASERVSVKAAFGTYHQSPQPADLSAVFGNPRLGISRATHWLAGTTVKLGDSVSAEVVGFYARSRDLVSRSEATTPLLAEALVQEAEGRAYGGQVLLRKELAGGFFGWASYSLIRSERRDHPGSGYRLFDYDQTHVATAVASYELGRGFEVGTRLRFASGYPRTPVVGAFFDSRRDLYEPYFGAHNSTRVPAFVQADVRVAKRFELGGDEAPVRLEVFVDVQNVTNRKNPEDVVYGYDYKTRGYITGLPLLPVAGARVEF